MILDKKEFKKDTFEKLAKVGVLTVTFYKADFTYRRMVCTLMPDILKDKPMDKGARYTYSSPVRVFDLEKDAWRSFVPSKIETAQWDCLSASDIKIKYPVIKTRVHKIQLELEVPKGNLDYVTVEHIKKALTALQYKVNGVKTIA
jgi:hypothetical protein